MTNRILYELVGRGDRRFSPFCWRIRMALKHKGLECEYQPIRFTDKDKIAFSPEKQVPVMLDNNEIIGDSWKIACYLEKNYGSPKQSLYLNGGTRFVNHWVDTLLHPIMLRCLIKDIYDHLDSVDRDYFRRTREIVLGETIENIEANHAQHELALQRILFVVRDLLRHDNFIGGLKPSYADYIVFGTFQWARCISPRRFLNDSDPIWYWFGRISSLYDGHANSVPHYY